MHTHARAWQTRLHNQHTMRNVYRMWRAEGTRIIARVRTSRLDIITLHVTDCLLSASLLLPSRFFPSSLALFQGRSTPRPRGLVSQRVIHELLSRFSVMTTRAARRRSVLWESTSGNSVPRSLGNRVIRVNTYPVLITNTWNISIQLNEYRSY